MTSSMDVKKKKRRRFYEKTRIKWKWFVFNQYNDSSFTKMVVLFKIMQMMDGDEKCLSWNKLSW